jgi:hypothetical protein
VPAAIVFGIFDIKVELVGVCECNRGSTESDGRDHVAQGKLSKNSDHTTAGKSVNP